ncbi:hypothetical protein ACOME3_002147 [Neoechinorhynchus agilis]
MNAHESKASHEFISTTITSYLKVLGFCGNPSDFNKRISRCCMRTMKDNQFLTGRILATIFIINVRGVDDFRFQHDVRTFIGLLVVNTKINALDIMSSTLYNICERFLLDNEDLTPMDFEECLNGWTTVFNEFKTHASFHYNPEYFVIKLFELCTAHTSDPTRILRIVEFARLFILGCELSYVAKDAIIQKLLSLRDGVNYLKLRSTISSFIIAISDANVSRVIEDETRRVYIDPDIVAVSSRSTSPSVEIAGKTQFSVPFYYSDFVDSNTDEEKEEQGYISSEVIASTISSSLETKNMSVKQKSEDGSSIESISVFDELSEFLALMQSIVLLNAQSLFIFLE